MARAIETPPIVCHLNKPEARPSKQRIQTIGMVSLPNEKDGIQDGWRSGTLEAELREINLLLANAMHQIDA